MTGSRAAIEGYTLSAAELIARYDDLAFADVHRAVQHLYPSTPARVLDIGSGTGRDAAYLAGLGHDVVAVEPVEPFLEHARRTHASPRIRWCNDSLPALAEIDLNASAFDLILVTAVWQHLTEAERALAMPRVTELLAPGGVLSISLRHGPGAPGRPVHPIDVGDTLAAARTAGLRCEPQVVSDSIQEVNRSKGVTWTRLILRRA